jgi:hypothetical protein
MTLRSIYITEEFHGGKIQENLSEIGYKTIFSPMLV